jgi:Flp pilus assembly pilin Flp
MSRFVREHTGATAIAAGLGTGERRVT